jgi:hypothetical protein
LFKQRCFYLYSAAKQNHSSAILFQDGYDKKDTREKRIQNLNLNGNKQHEDAID